MTTIVALAYPGMNYFVYQKVYKDNLDDQRMGPLLRMINNPFAFPDVWQTVGYISSWFVFIPSILVIMFITNEYTYKTHRQNVIDGWSRKQFMQSKMVDVLLVSLLTTILYFFTALVIGSLNQAKPGVNMWADIKYIPLFFLQMFSQLSLAFLIAFLTRKAFIALGIFIFYYFLFEPILVALGRKFVNDAGRFMPLEISDRLIPFPRFFVSNEAEWNRLMTESNVHIIYTVLLTGLVWGLCYWINNRRDL